MTEPSPSRPIAAAATADPPAWLALRNVVRRPMPFGVRGALVRSVQPLPTGAIRVTWLPAATPDQLRDEPRGTHRLRPGCVMLAWAPAVRDGMDVTASLGLTSTEVALATWPGLSGNWSPIVHPTVHEVIGLHAALSVATDALRLSNHLASN